MPLQQPGVKRAAKLKPFIHSNMKKLKLNPAAFGNVEVLSREQLKNVIGGLLEVGSGSGGNELCRIMWYDANGTYQETDILSNSAGANSNCVAKIQAGARRCWYDCNGDGWD